MIDLVLRIPAVAQELRKNLVDDVDGLANGVVSVVAFERADEGNRPGTIGYLDLNLSGIDSPMLWERARMPLAQELTQIAVHGRSRRHTREQILKHEAA
jgi:hypothetical protein